MALNHLGNTFSLSAVRKLVSMSRIGCINVPKLFTKTLGWLPGKTMLHIEVNPEGPRWAKKGEKSLYIREATPAEVKKAEAEKRQK